MSSDADSQPGAACPEKNAADPPSVPPAPSSSAGLSEGAGYHLPPKEIRDIVDAPPPPKLSLSPQRDKILFLMSRALPPLSEFARPECEQKCDKPNASHHQLGECA